MAHAHSKSSRGCGSCGGSYSAPAPTPPVFDPCGNNMAISRPKEKSCGCGKRNGVCRCGSAKPRPAPARPRNYHKEDCPTFAVSCETKQALRDCVRTALCDLLKCLTDTMCPDGKFDINTIQGNPQLRKDLINCVGQAACSFAHCLPEALCPEPCEPAAPQDCLPCGYAVEVVK